MANVFIPFYVILPDGGTVLQNQLDFPLGRVMSPQAAATEFNAQIVYAVGSGVPPPNNFSPRIGVPPLPSNSILTIGIESTSFGAGNTVDDNGVVFPLVGAPGGTIEWRAFFFTEIPNSTEGEGLQTVRWTCGFEIPTLGEGGSGAGNHYSRDASRTTDGLGFAFRSLSNEARTFSLPVTSKQSWEQFYVRPRALPVGGNEYFWFCNGSVEGGATLVAGLTPGGAIEIYNKGNQAFPGTLIGTIPSQPVNTWFRLDLILQYTETAGQPGTLGAYVNGANVFNVGVTTSTGGGGGLALVQNHSSSSIGNQGSIASNGGEIDFDDWTNRTSPGALTGLDWLKGSHVRLILPLSADNWGATEAAKFRVLQGNPVAGQFASDHLDNAVNNRQLIAATDYKDYEAGCVAVNMGIYASSSGAGNITFTYVANYGTVTGPTGFQSGIALTQAVWATALFQPSLGVIPTALATSGSLAFIYDPGTIGAQEIQAFQGSALFLGTFGAEDDLLSLLPPRTGTHNAPYWDQPVATSFVAPTSPVELMSGTYVGNGTGQEIPTSIPVHFWWSRPLTSDTGGGHWWSTLLAGHDQQNQLPRVNRLVRAFRGDATGPTAGVYNISISGGDSQCNANGVTYQWVGFSDQGMRFLLNGAGAHKSSDASRVNRLADPGFTPEGAFLFLEALGGGNDHHLWKGPGHATNAASPVTTAEVATVASFGQGAITSKATNLNTDTPQFGYAAWRTTDGSGDAGRPVAITSYVGDGLGTRTIPLLLNGRFPHFAMVTPHDGISYFRDPSHNGTASQQVSGSQNASTAIRGGGADQLIVGATLNVLATVYEVFVLAGDATGGGGGGGGWSSNPTTPIFTVDTIIRATDGPFAPTDTKGWWMSDNGFTGSATLITNPLNPKHPRVWDKIAAFATGSAGMLGGSPGAGVTYNNHLIYAGDDYTVGSTAPIIRIFDGISDRLFVDVPPVGTTPAIAVMSMILVGGTIYFSTLDSGSTSSNFAGRVFALDINSANVTQVGGGFSGGEVPYTLVYHMNRLWCGTNKSSGAGGKVYFFRPGIDTAWTTDYTLATSTAGGACSLASFNGNLYVGCDASVGVAAKILQRDPLGAYTTSHTAAGTAQNNGHLSMLVFGDNLYAGYWNPATDALVKQFNGTTWATVYTGSTTTIRPFIGMFESSGTLFVVGGGDNLSASLVSSLNGSSWDNLTPFLTGPVTETALPIFGQVGV